MLDIHDSYIISYTRDFKDKSLIMRIETDTGKNGKIIFKKVLVNFFEKELIDGEIGGILYGIEEGNINEFIKSKYVEQIFTKSNKFSLPIDIDSYNQLIDFIARKNKYNIYYIDSSYGINGWIICEEFLTSEE